MAKNNFYPKDKDTCNFFEVCWDLGKLGFACRDHLGCSYRQSMMANGVGILITPDEWLKQIKERVLEGVVIELFSKDDFTWIN